MHTCIYFVIIFSYFCELWTFVIYDPNMRIAYKISQNLEFYMYWFQNSKGLKTPLQVHDDLVFG